MKNQSSYQARLQDIALLKLEIQQLKKDIYSLMGENGEFEMTSARFRWRLDIDMEHAMKFGDRQLRLFEPATTKGIFPEITKKAKWWNPFVKFKQFIKL